MSDAEIKVGGEWCSIKKGSVVTVCRVESFEHRANVWYRHADGDTRQQAVSMREFRLRFDPVTAPIAPHSAATPAHYDFAIQPIDAIRALSRWRNITSGVKATVTGVDRGLVVFRLDDGEDLFDRLESDFRREFTPVDPNPVPVVKSFATGAVRSLDAESTRYDLVSPIGLRRLAETYAEGAAKYGAGNWLKGIPSSDLLNHLMKHVDSFRMGDESEDHLAHAAWGLFALMHFQETRPDLMDHGVFAICEKGAS